MQKKACKLAVLKVGATPNLHFWMCTEICGAYFCVRSPDLSPALRHPRPKTAVSLPNSSSQHCGDKWR